MTHKISVDFTGLCVFATENVPHRLSVLMASDTMHEMGHRPILSFNVRNLKLFTGESMGQVIQLPNGAQIASWNLDRKIVRLLTGKQALPQKVVLCGGGAPRSEYPEGPQSEMDLCWVPSLQRITGQGQVNPVYLSDNPVPKDGKPPLAARVEIDRGFLFSNAAANRLQPLECWTIKAADGKSIQQYLADTVRLEIDATAGQDLIIEATPFGGGLKERLELEPWEDRIELSITNLSGTLPHGRPAKTMMHFGAYYDLLPTAPKDRPLPETMGAAPHDGTPHDATAHGATPHETHHSGMTAAIEGVYPVKCAPGIVP